MEDSLDDHLFQNFKLEFLKAYVFIMQNLSNYHSIHYPRTTWSEVGKMINQRKRKETNRLFKSRCIH